MSDKGSNDGESAAGDAIGGGATNTDVKDELGLLISAWLFDPKVSEELELGRIDEVLQRTGLASNTELRDALRTIDVEQIRRLVETFRRPGIRPMG